MKIGVISDTHGFLDPQVPALFAGVEHILHAGDIGSPGIIDELGKIAPVTAVLGNNDAGLAFRETEIVVLGGKKFLIHHIVMPGSLKDPLRERVAEENPDVVVFGHTHAAFEKMIGPTLYLNPGYAGRQRFKLERSVAVLNVGVAAISRRFIPL